VTPSRRLKLGAGPELLSKALGGGGALSYSSTSTYRGVSKVATSII
jgi:hypothetical protein